jgi:ribulose-5-phosphate 4-epimerase/fuculose-1-phosphate aldolase
MPGTLTTPAAVPAGGTADRGAEELRLRRELAAVHRLVAHFRMTDLVFTHISVRVPGPEQHFLITPYGLLFEEVTASNLVKTDPSGTPVEETPHPVNPAGFVIHSAIHAAREDAHCVLRWSSTTGSATTPTRASRSTSTSSGGWSPTSAATRR